jgi:hypothetical protein
MNLVRMFRRRLRDGAGGTGYVPNAKGRRCTRCRSGDARITPWRPEKDECLIGLDTRCTGRSDAVSVLSAG